MQDCSPKNTGPIVIIFPDVRSHLHPPLPPPAKGGREFPRSLPDISIRPHEPQRPSSPCKRGVQRLVKKAVGLDQNRLQRLTAV